MPKRRGAPVPVRWIAGPRISEGTAGLKALVRLLARRAAERDYRDALKEAETTPDDDTSHK